MASLGVFFLATHPLCPTSANCINGESEVMRLAMPNSTLHSLWFATPLTCFRCSCSVLIGQTVKQSVYADGLSRTFCLVNGRHPSKGSRPWKDGPLFGGCFLVSHPSRHSPTSSWLVPLRSLAHVASPRPDAMPSYSCSRPSSRSQSSLSISASVNPRILGTSKMCQTVSMSRT